MNAANIISRRTIGTGLLALLAAVPLLYAQRAQPWGQGRDEAPQGGQPSRGDAPRAAPPHAPVERTPVAVDRDNHGSIRHVDAYVEHRTVDVRREAPVRRDVQVHRDVEVDIRRLRFWHSFVFGARFRALPEGCIQLVVGGSPYFYNDGIYYQQAADGYQEVYPPVGAVVPQPPDGAVAIEAGNLTYYYAGGAFYVLQDSAYVIAPTPIGVTVPELPPGAVQVSDNGALAYQFNGIYYRPVFVSGVTQYMTITP